MASSTWGTAQACAKKLLSGGRADWLCRQQQFTEPRNGSASYVNAPRTTAAWVTGSKTSALPRRPALENRRYQKFLQKMPLLNQSEVSTGMWLEGSLTLPVDNLSLWCFPTALCFCPWSIAWGPVLKTLGFLRTRRQALTEAMHSLTRARLWRRLSHLTPACCLCFTLGWVLLLCPRHNSLRESCIFPPLWSETPLKWYAKINLSCLPLFLSGYGNAEETPRHS